MKKERVKKGTKIEWGQMILERKRVGERKAHKLGERERERVKQCLAKQVTFCLHLSVIEGLSHLSCYNIHLISFSTKQYRTLVDCF